MPALRASKVLLSALIELHIESRLEVFMLRSFFVLVLLSVIVGTAAAQTKPTDSQNLEAILGEIRQLRQNLRTATMAAQRAQILVYRFQMQDAVVRHLQDRIEDTRSKLAQIQHEEKRLTTAAKQMEQSQDQSESPKDKKELEDTIARIKAGVENQSNLEQKTQARLIRIEQAKLSTLQDEFERLDKKLQ